MKIAVLAAPLHPLPTSPHMTWSPGVAATNLIAALTRAGHKVRVYAAQGSSVEADELIDFGMPAFNHPELTPVQQTGQQLFYVATFFHNVVGHLRVNPVDIVHLHDVRLLTYMESCQLPIPVVATLHGDYAYNFSSAGDAVKELLRRSWVLPLTPTKPRNLPEPHGFIPNTIDVDKYNLIDRPRQRLVYAGRMTNSKGADLIFDIAKASDLPVEAYGAQFQDPEFEREFKEQMTKSRIRYQGYVPHADHADLFNATASLILSRIPEGMPLAILESMAVGTPVVALNSSPAIQYLIKDGVNGYRFELDDSESLMRALDQTQHIDREACREYARELFGYEAVAKIAEQVYARAIAAYNHN